MGDEKNALVEAWLRKAEEDLTSARVLFDAGQLATCVYHCQQAAEKAIKSALTARDLIFPKIHNLTELLEMGLSEFSTFSELEAEAARLTPFATEFRYPGDIFEPPHEEAANALQDAETIVTRIRGLLQSE